MILWGGLYSWETYKIRDFAESFRVSVLEAIDRYPFEEMGKLGASLTDIDHQARSGCQRFLLPTSVTGVDLKPIVVEQGFHLLGKDIAQGCAKHLLLVLTSWMEKL